jgi:hypothetical protein
MATSNSNSENGDRRNDSPDARADDGSVEIARGGRPQQRWREVEVLAPYVEIAGRKPVQRDPGEPWDGPTGRGVIFRNEAVINIRVRELQGNELGALAFTGDRFEQAVSAAERRKSAEDQATYGMTTAQLREASQDAGYYGSRSHVAWSEAASARTGGRLSAEWFREFDPYGGTNGHGPNVRNDGEYPNPMSRIGMAHDTDWTLGRHFQAGPLRALYGLTGHSAQEMGEYGVIPNLPNHAGVEIPGTGVRYNTIRPGVDIYTDGHPDWQVNYQHRSRRAELGEGETVVASNQLVPGNDNLNRQFAQALQGTSGDRDAAAAAIDAISRSPGYRPDQDIAVVQGRNGQLIATQGQGDAALNVAVPKANPGDFERVANQIAQAPQPTQVAAVQPDQPERARTV